MIKFILSILLVFLFVFSYGQKMQVSDNDKVRINKVCDSFMQLFLKEKISESMDLLKKNSVMDSEAIDTLEVTILSQMEVLLLGYGKMIAFDFVTEKRIKEFLSKRFYVVRFEKYYLKFEFTLYKGAKGWTITNFKYDENISELLN